MRVKNQKILIFSDTHLSKSFDTKTFNFLKKIITSADQVIINGDFWDSWFTDFDGFLRSEWKGLFPLLLKKNTVYIYGNHDAKSTCDRRVRLFSLIASDSYEFTHLGKKYRVEHGHKILKGKTSTFMEWYRKLVSSADKNALRNILFPILHFFEFIGYRYLGGSVMTNSKISLRHNRIMKQSNKGKKFLICGDSHHAEIDERAKYANSGSILYGNANYLIIENGKIHLHKKDY